MSARNGMVSAWIKSHQGKKLTRYLLGSIVTTAISFIWITVMYGLKIIPGVIWATLSGNLLVVIPSYYWNRALAWGKRGKSHFRHEVVPYWTMAFLSIAFSQLGAFWARHEVHSHDWSRLNATALVAGTNLVCFGVFFVLKLMVFNRIFHVARPQDDDADVVVHAETTI
ncbi:MAG: GtrA family protein [Acidimicrobiales bacterium]